MKSPAVVLMLSWPVLLCGQTGNITNTLGTGGAFTVKDGTTTFLSLGQSDGYLSLAKSLTLSLTTGSVVGVIYKGTNRFIHDYTGSGTDGNNTFVGVNAGNFTLQIVTAEGPWEAS
jgi:hypothetical protein